jgi:hypothetical protein
MQLIMLKGIGLAAATAGFCVMTGPSLAAPLAAHRAIYDIQMLRNDRDSGYLDATGRLAYEITGSTCEGWSVSYRFASRYVATEGTEQLLDTQFTSWEAGDGTELRVNHKHFVNNNLNAENKTVVKRAGIGLAGKGEVNLPEMKTFELDAKTLFPATFQSKMLDEAKIGKSRNAEFIYEGTEGDKIYRVVNFIKQRAAVTALSGSEDALLKPLAAMPVWHMSTSYFETGAAAGDEPVYQSTYRMFENGVSADLVFDYGAYALKGKLTKLDLLPSAPCD